MICVLFALLGLFSACKEYDNTNINSNIANANQAVNVTRKNIYAKDDTVELGKVVNLPATPEESDWREEPISVQQSGNQSPISNKRKLTAVLKFSAEDAQRIVEQAEKYDAPKSAAINTEDWFPAELIAQSQLSGDETLKGTAYAANDFILQPYTSGRIARIEETDYFVLELFAN